MINTKYVHSQKCMIPVCNALEKDGNTDRVREVEGIRVGCTLSVYGLAHNLAYFCN